MNSPAFTFVLGALVGVAATAASLWKPEKEATARQNVELQAARAEVAKLRDRLVSVQTAPQTSAASDTLPKPGGGTKISSSIHILETKADEQIESLREKMQEQKEKLRLRKIDARLARFTSKLALSDEQSAAVKDLLEAFIPSHPSVFAGEASDLNSVLDLENGMTTDSFDNAMLDLLDEDQQLDYAEAKEQERANAIEANANHEMAALQKSLDLDEDQKDAIFEVLTELATEEHDPHASPTMLNIAALKRKHERRREMLEPLLTEEQFSLFEQSSSQNVIMINSGSVVGGLVRTDGQANEDPE